jgi:hypothetical protein
MREQSVNVTKEYETRREDILKVTIRIKLFQISKKGKKVKLFL